jgi:hypothetical protein
MGRSETNEQALPIEIRSPNEKSLLLLGLIANKYGQRMHVFSQAGGGRRIRTGGTLVRRVVTQWRF